MDPQHSIILSAAFLCIPGIIYNLQKARVIDCMYISCLKMTQYGMPLYLCTYQRAYGYCKFVYGELFAMLPLKAISQIFQNILKAFSDPAELLGFALSLACDYLWCTEPAPGPVVPGLSGQSARHVSHLSSPAHRKDRSSDHPIREPFKK